MCLINVLAECEVFLFLIKTVWSRTLVYCASSHRNLIINSNIHGSYVFGVVHVPVG